MENEFFKSQRYENWIRDGVSVRDRQSHWHIDSLMVFATVHPSWFASTDDNISHLGPQNYEATIKIASDPQVLHLFF